MNQPAESNMKQVLEALGVTASDGDLVVTSPVDGGELGRVTTFDRGSTEAAITNAAAAFEAWRSVPAPQRGELIRLFGDELRNSKEALGTLVTMECGKLLAEGLGEVQEMIDICDFAVGLSRQLYGLTMPSERPGHRLSENWQPLGPVAVISAW